ncbi:hypothetical protein Q1W73_01535 [Asticcacaulis sp. ZE23SCel15]|uniref:hypothetical protein n=1 Tax=Asticcacaulis sp. ZE23SCel15 TaxID=3059027 RepID=UPI00265FD0A7|nr:hypothetical protein [Asticcacaulis sp. ZE23SCel15]WKL57691.1 hypothetical protein Q1W73_01535 [Asticcacaulis sp. ZE23SCel15]
MVKWLKTWAAVLLAILTGSQALAQTPMTETEEQPFYDLLNRTHTASSSGLTAILAENATPNDRCLIAAKRTEQMRAGARDAFIMLQKFRAQGKSTDTLHKSYLSLTGSGDNAAVFETEFCAKVDEEADETERQISALTILKQQANSDVARLDAEGDVLNACARAAAAQTYGENVVDSYDTLVTVYSATFSDDRARETKYKNALAQAKREQLVNEALKTQSCAKVVFKDPPPKPPLPQSDEDKALSAITTSYLPVMESFGTATKAILTGDFKTACAAVNTARRHSESTEIQLRDLILKLSDEGKDTQKYKSLLNSYIENSKDIIELETKVCAQSINEDRGKEIETELEQRFQSLQTATTELNAASQSKDLVQACKSSRRGGQDLRRIITLMREAMAMEGEMASAELAEAETALNTMTKLAQDFEAVSAKTCPK